VVEASYVEFGPAYERHTLPATMDRSMSTRSAEGVDASQAEWRRLRIHQPPDRRSDVRTGPSGSIDVNPNSKIPALIDHSGDKPVRIFESGALLTRAAFLTCRDPLNVGHRARHER
jgi:hypothetical protein